MLPVRRRLALPHQPSTSRTAPRPRAAPFCCRLIIMVRAPVAGRVKTRLAADAGVTTAVRFARHRAGAVVQRVGSDPRWSTVLAVTPDSAVRARIWPRRVRVIPQGRGDLGVRMQRLIDGAPPGPVIIIGSDVPDVGSAHIAAAFRRLRGCDAVLGPAEDGGYWLVGLRRYPRRLAPFRGVRWSTPHALADTLGNLGGCAVALAARLHDVDNGADLARCAGRWSRRIR
jgi:rSAM/selenodomain-associated transferase 1